MDRDSPVRFPVTFAPRFVAQHARPAPEADRRKVLGATRCWGGMIAMVRHKWPIELLVPVTDTVGGRRAPAGRRFTAPAIEWPLIRDRRRGWIGRPHPGATACHQGVLRILMGDNCRPCGGTPMGRFTQAGTSWSSVGRCYLPFCDLSLYFQLTGLGSG